MPEMELPIEYKKQRFQHAITRTATAIQECSRDSSAILLHHNDADGLAAGYILNHALTAVGFDVQRVCLESNHLPLLRRAYDQSPSLVVLADLGNVPKEVIDATRKDTSVLTVNIDHHGPESPRYFETPTGTDNFFDLNCVHYGIKGSTYASGSAIAHLLAHQLSEEAAKEVAHASIIGGVGDRNLVKGRFPREGIDNIVAEIPSEKQRFNHEFGGYEIALDGVDFKPVEVVTRDADILGTIGYRKQGKELTGTAETDSTVTGPELAVKLLQEGYCKTIKTALEHLRGLVEIAYTQMTGLLREHAFQKLDDIMFFDASDVFSDFSVKTIGNFCNHLIDNSVIDPENYGFVDPNKYLVGGQVVKKINWGGELIDVFPGQEVLKLSFRTPHPLRKTKKFERFPIFDLVKKINPAFSDVVKTDVGATFVTREKLNELLSNMQHYIIKGEANAINLQELF